MSEELKTVARVDLARYLGTWCEIARKPMRFEDATARDITATYALEGPTARCRVTNSCLDAEGGWMSSGPNWWMPAATLNSEVTFLPYRRLALDPVRQGRLLDPAWTRATAPRWSANPGASTCGCYTADRGWTNDARRMAGIRARSATWAMSSSGAERAGAPGG